MRVIVLYAIKTRVALVLSVVCLTGCASSYHCYDGCSIDCGYCPPTALPYPSYPEGVCHSSSVSEYLLSDVAHLQSEAESAEQGTSVMIEKTETIISNSPLRSDGSSRNEFSNSSGVSERVPPGVLVETFLDKVQ